MRPQGSECPSGTYKSRRFLCAGGERGQDTAPCSLRGGEAWEVQSVWGRVPVNGSNFVSGSASLNSGWWRGKAVQKAFRAK